MRDLLINIYSKGIGKDKRFISNGYEMFDKTIFEKEIKKSHYLEDKKLQLKTVRGLLKTKDNTSTISDFDKNRLEIYCKENNIDYFKVENNSLFYNEWVTLGYVRELEISDYIQDIFNKAEKLLNSSKYDAICYLIDEQFRYHKNLFESRYHDVLYSYEYNRIIYELLQHKIYEISKIEYAPIGLEIEKKIRKPLIWKGQKTAIGTLFGILHKHNIIEGSKTDIKKALHSMFKGLSLSTLENNIKLSSNKLEKKYNYDRETVRLTEKWISHLSYHTKK